MRIGVFSICYNEEWLLPYFFRHYRFAERITIFDNMSTDGSAAICRQNGAQVCHFETDDSLATGLNTVIKNECWQHCGLDWVIVVDLDEFIYHHNITHYLSRQTASILISKGYEMVSDRLPTGSGQIYDEIRWGVPSPMYSKWCVFQPKIKVINFGPGAHKARPHVPAAHSELKLLHFKHLNVDWLYQRHLERRKRIPEWNKLKRWSGHYFQDKEALRAKFAALKAKAVYLP